MKRAFLILSVVFVSLGAFGTLSAQESIIETVANGCKTEIETYCKAVTPGEGRIWLASMLFRTSCQGNANTRFTTQPQGSSGR